mgnify:CR=1 FL=1
MNLTNTLLASAILLSSQLAFANHHGDHEKCEGMKNSDFSLKNLDKNNDGATIKVVAQFCVGHRSRSLESRRKISRYNHTMVTSKPKAQNHSMYLGAP